MLFLVDERRLTKRPARAARRSANLPPRYRSLRAGRASRRRRRRDLGRALGVVVRRRCGRRERRRRKCGGRRRRRARRPPGAVGQPAQGLSGASSERAAAGGLVCVVRSYEMYCYCVLPSFESRVVHENERRVPSRASSRAVRCLCVHVHSTSPCRSEYCTDAHPAPAEQRASQPSSRSGEARLERVDLPKWGRPPLSLSVLARSLMNLPQTASLDALARVRDEVRHGSSRRPAQGQVWVGRPATARRRPPPSPSPSSRPTGFFVVAHSSPTRPTCRHDRLCPARRRERDARRYLRRSFFCRRLASAPHLLFDGYPVRFFSPFGSSPRR